MVGPLCAEGGRLQSWITELPEIREQPISPQSGWTQRQQQPDYEFPKMRAKRVFTFIFNKLWRPWKNRLLWPIKKCVIMINAVNQAFWEAIYIHFLHFYGSFRSFCKQKATLFNTLSLSHSPISSHFLHGSPLPPNLDTRVLQLKVPWSHHVLTW